jgi:uracil-DNA glycosylase family 4
MPADILFVGLGPGKTENLLGQPFVGESGRLLQVIISHATEMAVRDGGVLARTPTYFITNMVGCRPCDSKYGPNRDPAPEEIWACVPRVQATHKLVQPALVILLGKLTNQFYGSTWACSYHFQHPRYLLGKGGVGSPMYVSYVRRLSEAIAQTIARRK